MVGSPTLPLQPIFTIILMVEMEKPYWRLSTTKCTVEGRQGQEIAQKMALRCYDVVTGSPGCGHDIYDFRLRF